MYRIFCRKLQVLIRLAIIMSLAGYPLSIAAAATHSAPPANDQVSVIQMMDHVDTHMASDESHPDYSKVDQGSKLAKQDCCYDSCVGFALVTCRTDTSGPVVLAAREFIDEHGITGEIPGLHRPPKI
tara:strand:+ start:7635 stop:8015 length:381 start_codon:yes stop_codon:yes gene_type:complete